MKRWFIAMIVLGIAGFVGLHLYQRALGIKPIQKYIPKENQEAGTRLDMPITISGTQGVFYSRIWYREARKGPAASLTICRDDQYTSEIRVALSGDMTGKEYFPLYGSRGSLNVAEHYLEPGNAFMAASNLDEDAETEFFIRSCDTVNDRENPMPEGDYILDYNRAKHEWTLGLSTNPLMFLRLIGGWGVFRIKAVLLCIALIGLVGSIRFNAQAIRAIVGAGLIIILLPYLEMLLIPALLGLIVWLIVVWRRRRRSQTVI